MLGGKKDLFLGLGSSSLPISTTRLKMNETFSIRLFCSLNLLACIYYFYRHTMTLTFVSFSFQENTAASQTLTVKEGPTNARETVRQNLTSLILTFSPFEIKKSKIDKGTFKKRQTRNVECLPKWAAAFIIAIVNI